MRQLYYCIFSAANLASLFIEKEKWLEKIFHKLSSHIFTTLYLCLLYVSVQYKSPSFYALDPILSLRGISPKTVVCPSSQINFLFSNELLPSSINHIIFSTKKEERKKIKDGWKGKSRREKGGYQGERGRGGRKEKNISFDLVSSFLYDLISLLPPLQKCCLKDSLVLTAPSLFHFSLALNPLQSGF